MVGVEGRNYYRNDVEVRVEGIGPLNVEFSSERSHITTPKVNSEFGSECAVEVFEHVGLSSLHHLQGSRGPKSDFAYT